MQFPVSPEVVEALTDLRKRKHTLEQMVDLFLSRLEGHLSEIDSQEEGIWQTITEEHKLDLTTHDWTIKTLENGSTVVVSSPKGALQ